MEIWEEMGTRYYWQSPTLSTLFRSFFIYRIYRVFNKDMYEFPCFNVNLNRICFTFFHLDIYYNTLFYSIKYLRYT